MNQEIVSTFRYLQNVLGINQIQLKGSPTESSGVLTFLSLGFLVSEEESQLEIFKKMIAAMKLDPSLYEIRPPFFDGRFYSLNVVFGKENFFSLGFEEAESGQWMQRENGKFLWTYSPAELEAEPSLKKRAWSDLQVVMREMNQ
ncbi:MAG: hypothetical protein AB7O96_04325 [Pseudobdellovibrionaceae bacterium]